MLIDEKDSNVFSLLCEAVERLLYCRGLGFGVDHKEILLRIRWLCDMLGVRQISEPHRRTRLCSYPYARQEQTSDGVLDELSTVIEAGRCQGSRTYFVANDSKEMALSVC